MKNLRFSQGFSVDNKELHHRWSHSAVTASPQRGREGHSEGVGMACQKWSPGACGNQEALWSLSGLTQALGRRGASPNLLASLIHSRAVGRLAFGITGAKFLAKQA